MAKKKDGGKGNETQSKPLTTGATGFSNVYLAIALVIAAAAAVTKSNWPSNDAAADSGWAMDPDAFLLDLFLAAPCNIKRVDASTVGKRFSADWKEPVILTNPSGGCGPGCAEAWRRDSFVSKFGKLPMALSSQLGVAYFGPNTDDGHRHGWPQSLEEAVTKMENATAMVATAGADESDGRDKPFAFDGSDTLLNEIIKGTPGWEGSTRYWWPDQFAEITGRPILSMGPSRAGLPFHDHEATFLWLVHGHKQWFLLPPGSPPDGVPKAGEGSTIWSWLTSKTGTLQFPKPEGDLGELQQCIQKPGEVFFVPRRWQHATLNVGIALGFGGQGSRQRKERSLAEIDAELAQSPHSIPVYLEKVSVTMDVKEKITILRKAHKVDPNNFEVWINLLQVMASVGAFKALADQAAIIWKLLEASEASGALSAPQVSVVLGHLSGVLVDSPKVQQGGKAALGPALDFLAKAVERDATNDYAVFYLGAANMMSGDMAKAEKYFVETLKLKPKHQKAQMALKMVKQQKK